MKIVHVLKINHCLARTAGGEHQDGQEAYYLKCSFHHFIKISFMRIIRISFIRFKNSAAKVQIIFQIDVISYEINLEY